MGWGMSKPFSPSEVTKLRLRVKSLEDFVAFQREVDRRECETIYEDVVDLRKRVEALEAKRKNGWWNDWSKGWRWM